MTADRDRSGSDDPTVIRSIAVTAEDVIVALEASRRSGTGAVLRVTPPFAGRMRARLHVAGGEGRYDEVRPLHVPPEDLIDDAAPPYPEVDETEDELCVDGEYDVAEHRERHVDAVRSWREDARSHIVERVVLDTDRGPHPVDVKVLG